MAGLSNNAHKGDFVRVHYAYHPYYGKEFKVISVFRDNSIRIKAPNGQRRGIPLWMTDKFICQNIRESGHPFCSLEALRELMRIINIFGINKL